MVNNDSKGHRETDAGELDFIWCDYYGEYVSRRNTLNMAVTKQRIETPDGHVNGTRENAAKQEVEGGGKKGASRRKGPANGCWECSGDHYASECPKVRFSRTQWNTIKRALTIPRCVAKNVRTNQAVVEKKKNREERRKPESIGKRAKRQRKRPPTDQ